MSTRINYIWAPTDRPLAVGIIQRSGDYILAALLVAHIMPTIVASGRWSEFATIPLAIAISIAGTSAHLAVYLSFKSTTLWRTFRGGSEHDQKLLEQSIALWTVVCIFVYYGLVYDASGTYKPAWTEWLP